MVRGAWWASGHGVAESDMTEVTEHNRGKNNFGIRSPTFIPWQ